MPENSYATEEQEKDFQQLLSLGFNKIEAARLIYMRNHMTDQIEYREIVEESRRLNFIRWLIEHDRLEH
ncbi:MAG: hypothetical protein IMW89_16765 [Ktedonobacteraceae bacterium]|nr:hypothetical protein [Ktedonobacteraceae bacterium]